MGMTNSKSKYYKMSNSSYMKYNYRSSKNSYSQSSELLCHTKINHVACGRFCNKKRSCMKKKVLMLGLDGVGKTDLLTRLVSNDEQLTTADARPQPTLGYNVETIKIYSHHFCYRRCHKITLWDCGGQSSLQSSWPYHFSNTSLLLWLINVHDRRRLDANLQLLSQILTNRLLDRVPVLIVLYQTPFRSQDEKIFNENNGDDLLTNLEVAFRFLSTLSTSRASTFKWQVIYMNLNNNSTEDLKTLRQSFIELMEL